MSKKTIIEDSSDIDSLEIKPIEEDSSEELEDSHETISNNQSFDKRFKRLEDIVDRLENIDITPKVEATLEEKKGSGLAFAFVCIFALGIIGYFWLKNPQNKA